MEFRILEGDCLDVLRTIPDASVHCCVTSPPYWGLRDYGCEGQMGLERTPEEYVDKMVDVFREVRRVLRDDGTLWLNLGDSYMGGGGGNYGSGISTASDHGQHLTDVRNRRAFIENTGLKPKNLVGIPWRVAFALQADGWYLRQDIIWHKPNPMPESVRDRCTKAHEYVFLLAKSERYYYDAEAVKEAGVGRERYFGSERYSTGSGRNDAGPYNPEICKMRNRRSVWTVTTKPFKGAHFAVMPPDLVEPCILAGCPIEGTVLDPFAGSGTVAAVALSLGRSSIGIELNPQYVELAQERIAKTISSQPLLYNLEGE